MYCITQILSDLWIVNVHLTFNYYKLMLVLYAFAGTDWSFDVLKQLINWCFVPNCWVQPNEINIYLHEIYLTPYIYPTLIVWQWFILEDGKHFIRLNLYFQIWFIHIQINNKIESTGRISWLVWKRNGFCNVQFQCPWTWNWFQTTHVYLRHW